ncbi:MAG TPA: hypothetical protein VHZ50_04235 [Puia sp.]|jgi:hypothetical protein|nr:hypothetical protein [Puia sp.]
MAKQTPEIKTAGIPYKGRIFNIEYFFRQGQKETIVLLHGHRRASAVVFHSNEWQIQCETQIINQLTAQIIAGTPRMIGLQQLLQIGLNKFRLTVKSLSHFLNILNFQKNLKKNLRS